MTRDWMGQLAEPSASATPPTSDFIGDAVTFGPGTMRGLALAIAGPNDAGVGHRLLASACGAIKTAAVPDQKDLTVAWVRAHIILSCFIHEKMINYLR